MSMVAAIRYSCPWSGCKWFEEFAYRPVAGIYPNPSVVESRVREHLDWFHAGEVPDEILLRKPRANPIQPLDVRDPRCCHPSRYGEPCESRDARGQIRACKFCGRPM